MIFLKSFLRSFLKGFLRSFKCFFKLNRSMVYSLHFGCGNLGRGQTGAQSARILKIWEQRSRRFIARGLWHVTPELVRMVKQPKVLNM